MNLTQTAIIARKFVRFGLIFAILLLFSRTIYLSSVNLYRKFFPKPPPPPTLIFGKLPALPFPQKTDLPKFEFKAETATGKLPQLAPQANVYFMPRLSANFLSLDIAKERASNLGFDSEPQEISKTLYKFQSTKSPSSIEINIVTGVFSISYDLAADPSQTNLRPPAPEVAAATVRSYLSGADLLPKDLTGEIKHEFLTIEGQKLKPAISLSESNLVKINFFRKNYNDLPSFTSDPNESNVWFILGGKEKNGKIIAGQFHHLPIDQTQSGTYPIKTAEKAFNDLITSKGYIANPGLNSDAKVTIRKIYLGFYDPGVPVEFYQPIIVFEGDRGFIAYVPAVTEEYYGK